MYEASSKNGFFSFVSIKDFTMDRTLHCKLYLIFYCDRCYMMYDVRVDVQNQTMGEVGARWKSFAQVFSFIYC